MAHLTHSCILSDNISVETMCINTFTFEQYLLPFIFRLSPGHARQTEPHPSNRTHWQSTGTWSTTATRVYLHETKGTYQSHVGGFRRRLQISGKYNQTFYQT